MVQVAVMAPLGAAGWVATGAARVMLEVPGGTHVPVSVLGAQGWLCLLLGFGAQGAAWGLSWVLGGCWCFSSCFSS